MTTTLTVQGKSEESWASAKTVVLAIIMKSLESQNVKVQEDYMKIRLILPFNNAFKAMKDMISYFRDHYQGSPVNFSVEVTHTPENQ